MSEDFKNVLKISEDISNIFLAPASGYVSPNIMLLQAGKSIIIYMDFSILALVGVNNFFKSVSVEALVPQIFQLGMRDWFIGFFDPQVWKLAGLPRATWKAALLYVLDIFVFYSLV